MISRILHGRNIFVVCALIFVIASVFFSRYISKELAQEEKQRVEIWARSQSYLSTASSTDQPALNLAIFISSSNTDIPVIEADEHDHPTGNFRNLDTAAVRKDSLYLQEKLQTFKKVNKPILVQIRTKPLVENKYYYGESRLQTQLRYFPVVQIVVLLLFFTFWLMIQRSRNRNQQNLLWVGMAKETAHQLGTPLSSLEGWMELLKEYPQNQKIIPEMNKDLQRLMLISDRFGKIGSQPVLEKCNIVPQIEEMAIYMRRRAAGKISIETHFSEPEMNVLISRPLFDWVIENLLKNALDAMKGKGKIKIEAKEIASHIQIDITDTGKGMAHDHFKKVFEPGFTTKKRGWGLGLALTKRIVEEYHGGKIFVHWSEPEQGTTFRILLKVAL